MKKLKEILKTVFCPPPMIALFAVIFGFGFVLCVTVFDIDDPVLKFSSYIFPPTRCLCPSRDFRI